MSDDDYIDDDRDTITVRPLPRFDVQKELERGVEIAVEGSKEQVETSVTVGTEHVQAGGFWKRTREGVQSWGARLRAVWGRK